MNDRWTPEEAYALEKLRMYIRHGSPENYRHLTAAGRAVIHADFNRSKGSRSMTNFIIGALCALGVILFADAALAEFGEAFKWWDDDPK